MIQENEQLAELVRQRIEELHSVAPDSIGDLFRFRLERYDEAGNVFVFTCRIGEWMRNAAGTLHGGMCAAVLDQAMGFVAYCIKPGPGFAPTIQMQTVYHRPLPCDGEIEVRVYVDSRTKSLMNLRSEARAARSEKLCISASATYFYKPMEPQNIF